MTDEELLREALEYLEMLRDEGPYEDGWASRELQELRNRIRERVGIAALETVF